MYGIQILTYKETNLSNHVQLNKNDKYKSGKGKYDRGLKIIHIDFS